MPVQESSPDESMPVEGAPAPAGRPPGGHPAGDSRWRSVAKAVSWRVVGSLDTLILSYLFTGSVVVAGSIASTETLTKTVLYYLHERGWGLLPIGRA